ERIEGSGVPVSGYFRLALPAVACDRRAARLPRSVCRPPLPGMDSAALVQPRRTFLHRRCGTLAHRREPPGTAVIAKAVTFGGTSRGDNTAVTRSRIPEFMDERARAVGRGLCCTRLQPQP